MTEDRKPSILNASVKDSFLSFFAYWNDFNGRSSRSEYWKFSLLFGIPLGILVIVGIALISVAQYSYGNYNNIDKTQQGLGIALLIVAGFINILTIFPSIALGVRRLHDSGHSGLWFLINLVPYLGILVFLVFTLLPSNMCHNQYGGIKGENISPSQKREVNNITLRSSPNSQDPNPSVGDVANEIEKLSKLKDDGILTMGEFEQMKQRLIRRL